MQPTWIELERQARLWMIEAGERIKKAIQEPMEINSKSGPDDLVTDVDKATESFLYEKITSTYPDHHFLGEEGVAQGLSSIKGLVWIVDPIDGTMNFVHQKKNFAISIGIYENGIGIVGLVYDVMSGELFHAIKGEGLYVNDQKVGLPEERPLKESIVGLNANWLVEERPIQPTLLKLVRSCRGTRSYGSAALELAYVATDRMDAYISLNLSPWDYAGGAVLLAEAGCKSTRFSGEDLSMLNKGSMVAAKANLHDVLVTDYLNSEAIS